MQPRRCAQYLANFIEKTSNAYGMEISADNTKLMTNNINGIHKESKAETPKL